jgi:hypothetical protein
MEPVFDSGGRQVAWLHRGQFLIDRSNVCRAFLRGRVLFSDDRRVVGDFFNGYIWDTQGEAVAFVRGATNGPTLPAPRNCAPAPPPPSVVAPTLAPVVSALPTHRMKWSALPLDTMLALRTTPPRRERRRPRGRLGASFRVATLV